MVVMLHAYMTKIILRTNLITFRLDIYLNEHQLYLFVVWYTFQHFLDIDRF
jgi:hypothetical protein